MSTPSGRPANPIDLSNYEPRRAHERAIAEPHRSEDKTDTLRSPLKRATEPHPVKNPDLPPAGKPYDEITSDPDLKRLEASLRWLQCQEAAMRLPRATPLPPVPGLGPVDTTGRHRNSEMLVDSFRAQRSPEPERVASPIEMTSRRATRPWPIGILLASTLAVPIAYYMSVGSWDPRPRLGRRLRHRIKRSLHHTRMPRWNLVRPRPKTNMLKRRFQRSPPSARVRQPEHPRARRWRCCRGA